MSLADAHRFIKLLRSNPELLPENATIAAVIEAGRSAGFQFDESELRKAHGQDWLMRWMAGQGSAPTLADADR